ncbi:MAG: hypothetical protein AAGA56_11745 [Myxococcota bacterium]
MVTNQAAVRLSLGALLSVSVAGCAFAKRSPEMYRKDTTALLETKRGELKACYDGVLRENEKTSGSLTIFVVFEKDTGKITKTEVREAQVPAELQTCVENSLAGLVLQPGDADEGHGTFTYLFEPGPTPPAAPE